MLIHSINYSINFTGQHKRLRPAWNVPMLFNNLTTTCSNVSDPTCGLFCVSGVSNNVAFADGKGTGDVTMVRHTLFIDDASKLAIIVRGHSSYSTQLLSLLLSMEKSSSRHFTQVKTILSNTSFSLIRIS